MSSQQNKNVDRGVLDLSLDEYYEQHVAPKLNNIQAREAQVRRKYQRTHYFGPGYFRRRQRNQTVEDKAVMDAKETQTVVMDKPEKKNSKLEQLEASLKTAETIVMDATANLKKTENLGQEDKTILVKNETETDLKKADVVVEDDNNNKMTTTSNELANAINGEPESDILLEEYEANVNVGANVLNGDELELDSDIEREEDALLGGDLDLDLEDAVAIGDDILYDEHWLDI